MAIPSSLVFFFLSQLLIIFPLVVVKGEEKSHYYCQKESSCGKLGNISFPFTSSTKPSCGLWLIDCIDPNPRTSFFVGNIMPIEQWSSIINYTSHQIQMEVPKSCLIFQKNDRTYQEVVSISISPKPTEILLCDQSSSDREILLSNYLPGYGKFNGCEAESGFTIYYNYSNERILDYNGLLPPGCSTMKLPLRNSQFGKHGNFFDILAKEIALTWSVIGYYACKSCFDEGQECKVDDIDYNNSIMHCSDDLKDEEHLGRVLGPAISAGGVVVILALMLYIFRAKNLASFREKKSNDYQNIENFLRNCGSVSLKRFKYHEIKRITSSFKTKLGQGGFGSVFKGNLADDHPVAVKILSVTKGTGEEFVNEVASISNTSHVNVVKLLGFCFEYNKRALVYEYMPKGSLEKFIFRGKSSVDYQLEWPTLFKIAVGIARGLEYLHLFCATRMVHFDIKPHNVLLDEEYCPKISDFGLAKLCSENKSMLSLSGARGTIGYIAPEVVCKNFGGVSHKSDVYSFGMMILEMVGGRRNSDVECNESSQVYFPHWIYAQLEQNQEIVLPSVMNDTEKESARKMIIVSLWCIQTDPSQRPTMSRVVEMLEGNVNLLQNPPRPYLFSSANSFVADSNTDYKGDDFVT